MAFPAAVLCEDSFGMARDDIESIIAVLRSGKAEQMTHSDLERLVRKRGHELLRKLLQAHVDSRGPGKAAAPGMPDTRAGTGQLLRADFSPCPNVMKEWTARGGGEMLWMRDPLAPLPGATTQLAPA